MKKAYYIDLSFLTSVASLLCWIFFAFQGINTLIMCYKLQSSLTYSKLLNRVHCGLMFESVLLYYSTYYVDSNNTILAGLRNQHHLLFTVLTFIAWKLLLDDSGMRAGSTHDYGPSYISIFAHICFNSLGKFEEISWLLQNKIDDFTE